jgi:hypothetical protein
VSHVLTLAQAIEIADRFDHLLSEVICEYGELSGDRHGMFGKMRHTSLIGVEKHIRERETQIAEYREKIFQLKNVEVAKEVASANIRKIANRNGVGIQ